MKTKHTPEPWVFINTGFIVKGIYVKASGTIMACVPLNNNDKRQIAWALKASDSARIVACVNACAGMADPVAQIAELKKYAVYP